MTTPDKTPAHIRDRALDLRELADSVEALIRERDEALDRSAALHADVGAAIRQRDEARAERDRALSASPPATTVPRVITPDQLRDGQTVAALLGVGDAAPAWGVYQVTVDPSGPWLESADVVSAASLAEAFILLPDAPAPDPEPEPWEPSTGDVGIVTHYRGEELAEPGVARFGGAYWWPMDGRDWPDGRTVAIPSEVTVVRAKVVPDE